MKDFDRVHLQERVIDSILEGIDYKTLVQMAYDNMDSYFNTLGDADFIAEVQESHPHLIDDYEYDGQPDEAQEWYDFDPDA